MKRMPLFVTLFSLAGCFEESAHTVAKTVAPCTQTQPDVTVKKLSRQLSPQAKKAMLRAQPGDWIKGTLLLGAKTPPDDLTESLRKLGAKPGSWSETTHQMTVELPIACLESVVGLPEVMYFEAASAYSNSTDEN